MKNLTKHIISLVIISIVCCSCGIIAGAGGSDSGVEIETTGTSNNKYDLVPAGDRITYTIDISTPEGQRKLNKLSLSEAKRLAETEAARKYNCDCLLYPKFDYLKKGNRILRITVDGRPANYKIRK